VVQFVRLACGLADRPGLPRLWHYWVGQCGDCLTVYWATDLGW
jgi:hypothetical protein